jgi:hypothetical protein
VFQFGSLENFVLEKFGMLLSLAQKERKKEKKGIIHLRFGAMLGLCEFTISSFTNQFWHKTIVTTFLKMFVHMLEVFKISIIVGIKEFTINITLQN